MRGLNRPFFCLYFKQYKNFTHTPAHLSPYNPIVIFGIFLALVLVATFSGEKDMKTLILTLTLLTSLSSLGAVKDIICSTPRMNKVFMIKNSKIIMQGRDLASVEGVRTKDIGVGFTKYFNHEGMKHKLHIENKSSFSDFNDYISIRNNKGHEITYPLTCGLK